MHIDHRLDKQGSTGVVLGFLAALSWGATEHRFRQKTVGRVEEKIERRPYRNTKGSGARVGEFKDGRAT